MTAEGLADKYGFDKLTMPSPDSNISGCYCGDLLSWVMGRAQAENVWITIMSNINVAAVAALTGVSAVIFAEGVIPGEDVIAAAQAKGINLLASNLPEYETAVKISADV